MNSIISALYSFLMTSSAASYGAWDIDAILGGLNTTLRSWGGLLVVIIGLVMVIVAVFKIAKGLISHGKSQTNWVVNIVLFFVGGALCFGGGWGLIEGVSKGGDATLQHIGEAGASATTSTILLQLPEYSTAIGDTLVINL